MACSTRRRAAGLLLLLVLAGCTSGHLLDRARTRETLAAYRGVWLDDELLVVAWDATVSDHRGRPVGHAARVTAVPLEPLRRTEAPPVDTIPSRTLTRVPASPGRAVPLDGAAASARDDGVLVVRDPPAPDAVLYPGTLTRVPIAPWVWPLLPFTAAFDVVGTPVLVLLAPAVIVPGD
ncbi:MAG: hypothetical protein KIT14_10080 [bacterium]|nr:hypothetical protein [bacterium]